MNIHPFWILQFIIINFLGFHRLKAGGSNWQKVELLWSLWMGRGWFQIGFCWLGEDENYIFHSLMMPFFMEPRWSMEFEPSLGPYDGSYKSWKLMVLSLSFYLHQFQSNLLFSCTNVQYCYFLNLDNYVAFSSPLGLRNKILFSLNLL